MTTRADFDADGWETLIAGPWVSGVLVELADSHLSNAIGEFEALVDSVMHPGDASTELVEELIADIRERDEDHDNDAISEQDGLRVIRTAAGLVDSVCHPDEAAAYKQWVLTTARRTAEARKEGGFMGVGGARISDTERGILTRIQAALGL